LVTAEQRRRLEQLGEREVADDKLPTLTVLRCAAARSLGIWDAEVLEGKATTRWVGWPISDRKKMGHEQVVTFNGKRPFRRLGLECGDRCSIIVLPQKEGE
jgi:hypothetical protein